MIKTTIKLENFSSNGRDFRAAGVHVYIPAHSIGDKALIVDIPVNMVGVLEKNLKGTAPAIAFTVEGKTIVEPIVEAPEIVVPEELVVEKEVKTKKRKRRAKKDPAKKK